jgi:hypothetical protein
MQAYEGIQQSFELTAAVKKFATDIAKLRSTANTDAQKARLDMIAEKIKLLTDGTPQRPGTPVPVAEFPLGRLSGAFASLLELLQDADVAPSNQAVTASKDLRSALATAESSWKAITDMMAPK